MKRMLLLFVLVCFFNNLRAQVSIRVKDNPRSKEISVTTGGKRNAGNDTNTNTNTGNNSGSRPAETKTTPPPSADTTALPAPGAQPDESYNGPAKVPLKSFWRYLEKLRAGDNAPGTLGNAERMLGQVKEKDPGYNVAELEKEVSAYRSRADQAEAAARNKASQHDAERSYVQQVWQKLIGVYSSGNDIEPGVYGKSYYERMQALNIDEYRQKRTQLTSPEAQRFAAKIDENLADYDEYVKRADRLKWNVTEVMTKSRNASNPQEKSALLESARYECMAVLLLSPGNAPFKQKLEEINKLMGAADAEASRFFTSDFHKANLNQIVWSTQPLVIGKEQQMASVIKKEFKTGDYIYGTVYLGVNVKDAMDGNTNLRVRIRVDNGTAIWGGDLSYIEVPLTTQGKSYLQFALLPDAQWMKDNYGPYLAEENWTLSYFLDELARSGDISHTITVELMFPTSRIKDVDGAFGLDLGAGSAALKSTAAKLHEQMMATRQLPKAGMNNPSLAKQCLDAANGLGWKDQFLSCVITSAAWNVEKNPLTGAILYRYVGAVCTLKDMDGKCYYQEFTFRQDYTGAGNYSGTVKYNSYGGKREIGCDKLK